MRRNKLDKLAYSRYKKQMYKQWEKNAEDYKIR